MALRAAIAKKKADAEADASPAPAAAAPTATIEAKPAESQAPADASPPPAADAQGARAPARKSAKAREGGMKRGFLSKASGALYPDGSSESKPTGLRANAQETKLELRTTAEQYEIVGDFKEAGRFIGKEDFAVSRSGLSLRIRGNPQEDPQSLVSGFDQSVELPIDSDVAGLSADFRACALRVTVPRRKELPAELVEALKAMSPEELQELAEAQAKVRDGGREVDGPPAAKADEPDC